MAEVAGGGVARCAGWSAAGFRRCGWHHQPGEVHGDHPGVRVLLPGQAGKGAKRYPLNAAVGERLPRVEVREITQQGGCDEQPHTAIRTVLMSRADRSYCQHQVYRSGQDFGDCRVTGLSRGATGSRSFEQRVPSEGNDHCPDGEPAGYQCHAKVAHRAKHAAEGPSGEETAPVYGRPLYSGRACPPADRASASTSARCRSTTSTSAPMTRCLGRRVAKWTSTTRTARRSAETFGIYQLGPRREAWDFLRPTLSGLTGPVPVGLEAQEEHDLPDSSQYGNSSHPRRRMRAIQ